MSSSAAAAVVDLVDVDGDGQGEASTLPRQGSWACGQCTFVNSSTVVDCAMCMLPGPASHAAHHEGEEQPEGEGEGEGGLPHHRSPPIIRFPAGTGPIRTPSPHTFYTTAVDSRIWPDPAANASSLSWWQLLSPTWAHVPPGTGEGEGDGEVLTHACVASFGANLCSMVGELLALPNCHTCVVEGRPKDNPGRHAQAQARGVPWTPGPQTLSPTAWAGTVLGEAIAAGRITLVHCPMDAPGHSDEKVSQHVKMVLLRWTRVGGHGQGVSRVRLVITTSNLDYKDWNRTTQTVWAQDFFPATTPTPPPTRPQVGSGTFYFRPTYGDAALQLYTLLSRWLVPADHIAALGVGGEGAVCSVDWSTCAVDLIVSTPGVYYPRPKADKGDGGSGTAGGAGSKRPAELISQVSPAPAPAPSPPTARSTVLAALASVPMLPLCLGASATGITSAGHGRLRFLRAYQRLVAHAVCGGGGSATAAPRLCCTTSSFGGQCGSAYLLELYLSACGVPSWDKGSTGSVSGKVGLAVHGPALEAACAPTLPGMPAYERASMRAAMEALLRCHEAAPGRGRSLPSPLTICYPTREVCRSARVPHTAGHLTLTSDKWKISSFPRAAFAPWLPSPSTAEARQGILTHVKCLHPLGDAGNRNTSSSGSSSTTSSSGGGGGSASGPAVEEGARAGGGTGASSSTMSSSQPIVTLHRDWCYMGSHNSSVMAWGQLVGESFPGGIRLRVVNYELGVLFPPIYACRMPAHWGDKEREGYMARLASCGVVDWRPELAPQAFPWPHAVPLPTASGSASGAGRGGGTYEPWLMDLGRIPNGKGGGR